MAAESKTSRPTLSPEGLEQMTEDRFAHVLWNIHASREYARRAANARLGLPEGQVFDNPTKSRALAGRIWTASTPPGEKVRATLAFILYSGSPDDVPQRLWEALHDPRRRIEMLGVSSLGDSSVRIAVAVRIVEASTQAAALVPTTEAFYADVTDSTKYTRQQS